MPDFDPGKEYYDILGVRPNASSKEVASAYRLLATRYHPDKHQGNDLEDLARNKFDEVNEAYRVLSDESLRKRYNDARRHDDQRPAYRSGNYCAPSSAPSISGKGIAQLLLLVLLIAALPFLARIIRSPQSAIVLAITIAVVWFGPRIVKKLKR